MRRKQQQLPACAVSVEPDEFLGFLFLAAEKQPLSLSLAAAKPAPAHDLASTHARIIADVVDRAEVSWRWSAQGRAKGSSGESIFARRDN
jgi:hypothetical protein